MTKISTKICLLITLATKIQSLKYDLVTCGSLVKLYHASYEVRLHSHEVAYGTGSGQQSVTAVEQSDDSNSYWLVRGPDEDSHCTRGEPVKCGDKVRLTHLNTRKNLHTHNFRSPLSSQQEVSAYGDAGVGDHLDTWEIQCNTQNWARSLAVILFHPDTKRYLALSGKQFGRPIANQMEVIASKTMQRWQVMEGVYVKATTGEDADEEDYDHDEL